MHTTKQTKHKMVVLITRHFIFIEVIEFKKDH